MKRHPHIMPLFDFVFDHPQHQMTITWRVLGLAWRLSQPRPTLPRYDRKSPQPRCTLTRLWVTPLQPSPVGTSGKGLRNTLIVERHWSFTVIFWWPVDIPWHFQYVNSMDLSGPYLLTIRSMLLTKKLQAREWPRRLEATETMAPIDSCAKVSSESDRLKTWIRLGTSWHFQRGRGQSNICYRIVPALKCPGCHCIRMPWEFCFVPQLSPWTCRAPSVAEKSTETRRSLLPGRWHPSSEMR